MDDKIQYQTRETQDQSQLHQAQGPEETDPEVKEPGNITGEEGVRSPRAPHGIRSEKMSARSGETQSKAEQEGQSGPQKGLRNQKWGTLEKVTFV